MRVLLDTHAVLWLLADSPQLGEAARTLVTDPHNKIFVSAASLWEMTVKIRIGKLTANIGEILTACQQTDLRILPISSDHLLALAALPVFPDHRDPFDHLLMAQAITEGMTFLSEDRFATRYPVRVVRCSEGVVTGS